MRIASRLLKLEGNVLVLVAVRGDEVDVQMTAGQLGGEVGDVGGQRKLDAGGEVAADKISAVGALHQGIGVTSAVTVRVSVLRSASRCTMLTSFTAVTLDGVVGVNAAAVIRAGV